MSNFHATFKIKFTDLISIFKHQNHSKMSEKEQFKVFLLQSTLSTETWYGDTRGRCTFFLDLWPKMLSFYVEIGQKNFLKNCPKNDLVKTAF